MTKRCIYCARYHNYSLKEQKCKDCEKEYKMILDKLNRHGEKNVNTITNHINHQLCG